MRTRQLFGVATLGALALLAGCTLVSGAGDLRVADETDGAASSSSASSSGGDGSSGGSSSSSSSSSGDGGTSFVPHDSGNTITPNDAAAFDAAPGTFCGGYPDAIACTSFDDPDITFGFSPSVTPKSSLGEELNTFVSGPRSMVATIGPAFNPSHEEYASLDTSITKPVTTLHMRGSFRIVAVANPPNQGLEVAGGSFRGAGNEYQLNLTIDSTRHLFLQEWAPSPQISNETDLGPLADGWHVIDETITFATTPAGSTVVVSIDGKTQTVPITPNMSPPASVRWAVGASWAHGAQSGWAVGWDDYVLEAK